MNNTGDAPDFDTSDDVCKTTLHTAACTLRAAIQTANHHAETTGADAIHFAIGTGVVTIMPGAAVSHTPLPTITDAVTIDGTTQPGSSGTCLADTGHPCVELDGELLGSTGVGLRIDPGKSTVRGLVMNWFEDAGIVLETAGFDAITGNLIGTDPTGASASPNGVGVRVAGSSADVIGGTTAAARNVISGNTTAGVDLISAGNSVRGNYIGTDITGTATVHQPEGVAAEGDNETIGGTAAGSGNLVSGNTFGVVFTGANGLAQGNFIGTDLTGAVALQNHVGIDVLGASTIGGTAAGAGNVISGNQTAGVAVGGLQSPPVDGVVVQGNFIGTDPTGTTALPNVFGVALAGATNALIGGTDAGAGNVISGNAGGGVFSRGFGVVIEGADSTGNVVEGNLIGTDATGTAALPNRVAGVAISLSNGNRIGGTTTAARNVISGNGQGEVGLGVEIGAGATIGNVVEGNFIGTDVSGAVALPNVSVGVGLFGASGNVIGGTDPGAGNVISGNGGIGIDLPVSRGGIPTQNVVQGNLVGTTADGQAALPNAGFGIEIEGSKNVIGGAAAAAANVVSGNGAGGIKVTQGQDNNHNPVGGTGNRIQGNLIGVDASGSQALGNTGPGVDPTGSVRTLIGGSHAGDGNVISANAIAGIASGGGTAGARVLGNFIGTDRARTADLGNGRPGVQTSGGMIVGGSTAVAANVIASNAGNGVVVEAGRVQIRRNSIHDNDGLGIDLGDDGVTLNDPDDSDTGPNLPQNFPSITSAVTANGSTAIQGKLTSKAGTKFVLRLYSSPSCDPSGFGEGSAFLGSLAVLTGANGSVTFGFGSSSPVAAGKQITATATDPKGNTSEFSKCRAVTAG